VSEERVRERMRVEDVPHETEGLARRARQVASLRETEVSALKTGIHAEAYEGVREVQRRGLDEVGRNLGSPLARGIILYEVIGPPLALRRPERTFADYG